MKRLLFPILALVLALGLALPLAVVADTDLAFVTGGGTIETGKGKTAAKISFGGNVRFDPDCNPVGHWQVNFHNVNNDDLDKGHFHSTEILFLEFLNASGNCPEPDPPDADWNRANFLATGRFNREDGWKIEVRVADFGEPGKGNGMTPGDDTDGIRILLWEPDGAAPVYDSYIGGNPPGDFPDECDCSVIQTELDGGNIQIHRGGRCQQFLL